MLKPFVALILIGLQGVAALPGRLHLCFEHDGALCCIEGGMHDCNCDHEFDHECGGEHGDSARSPTAGGHEFCCGDVESNFGLVASADSSHQHVIVMIGASDSEVRRNTNLADESACELPMASLPLDDDFWGEADGDSLSMRQFHSRSMPFSLFARASTVMRC